MSHDPIVIVSAQRTPLGSFGGAFKTTPAATLGAASIKAALAKTNIPLDDIDEVIMGCVLQAGQGQAPARQAALGAGLPYTAGATTINKMCGSGLKAVMMAADEIRAGSHSIVVAGGMESMSNAPYLLPGNRFGQRMGHGKTYDHMFLDGLEDAYDRGRLMGTFADNCAQKYTITREDQDQLALASLARATEATEKGYFNHEITPVTVKSRKADIEITTDEGPANARPEKIPTLKPAFGKEGTVTAANASSISDGASALILMTESEAKKRGLTVLATLKAQAQNAHEPEWFSTAPIGSIEKILTQTGWTLDDVDLFEINEAFAVVTLVTMQQLNIPLEKVNVCGGACALGHPIGASGARILTTLIYALKRLGKKRGIASLCIGGGEAVALAIEV
jgi:acetyl-CoA C-acetyltransferase